MTVRRAVDLDQTRGWAVAAARAADDKKAIDPVVLDVNGILAITDFFVIASAPNDRLVDSIVEEVEAKVKDGTFREDLYYRLNVVSVVLAPLNERPEDVPLLVEHFLEATASRLKREAKPLTPAAYRALCAHEWKGNVRELEHAIEQALVLASGASIDEDDLPASVRGGGAGAPPAGARSDAGDPTTFKDAKQRVIERFEREFIEQSLARHHGNISKAAEDMGMYRQHLQVKLGEYGIDPEVYRRRS